VADDQQNWPTWDSDTGRPPSGGEERESVSGSLDDALAGELDTSSGALSGRIDDTGGRGHLPPGHDAGQPTRFHRPMPSAYPEQGPAAPYGPDRAGAASGGRGAGWPSESAGRGTEWSDEATQIYHAVSSQAPDGATETWGDLPNDRGYDGATEALPKSRMPEMAAGATEAFPRFDPDRAPDGEAPDDLGLFDEPTVQREPVAHGIYRADDEPEEPRRKLRSGLGRAMLVTGATLGVLMVAYVVDMVVSWGDVPRGVTVAGVDVGGLSRTAAEEKLRQELQPRFDKPVTVKAGDVETTLDPAESGLGVDWQATLEQAGKQPWNPITRLTSFWETREVGIVGKSDRPTLRKAVERLAKTKINHRKREGNITFKEIEGTDGAVQPVAVPPRQGQQLRSVDQAVETIEDTWLQLGGVRLDVDVQPVKATPDGVRATLEKLAKPAVAAPIEVQGDGVSTSLTPKQIGEAFEFKPQEDGSLKALVDREVLKKALEPALKPTEQEGQDAEIVFTGGKPTVKPAKNGRKVDWKKTFRPYLDVITKTEGRVLKVSYATKKPDLTTSEAKKLGIKEVIGEFTTGGFAPDSGINIRTVAAEVDGAIIKPGETFSLNEYTGPRTADKGYVEAGIIQNGVPGRAVGGGISQFATTLYNAAYFAGLKDAGHKEHSYYISRYPIAREATVFQAPGGGGIDLKITNDSDTGVAIQTHWTPQSITVKLWGTKRYRVESVTGPKTNVKQPGTQRVNGSSCEPSPGIPGFTATDTRILYDINTGREVRRETRTVTYNPKPTIVCGKRDDDDD